MVGRRPPEVEEKYHEKLNAFERKHGEISSAYWCLKAPSAVAMTVREKKVFGRHRDAEIRLYRVSDWVTAKANVPRIADLLHHCDTLAIKVSTVLKGMQKRVAMQWILALQNHLLGFIERSKDDKLDEKELKDLVQRAGTELDPHRALLPPHRGKDSAAILRVRDGDWNRLSRRARVAPALAVWRARLLLEHRYRHTHPSYAPSSPPTWPGRSGRSSAFSRA